MIKLQHNLITLTNGHILHYHFGGTGPALILLIGSDTTSNTWCSEFIQSLAINFSIYLVDYWGINSNATTVGNTNFSKMAEDIYLFCNQLKLVKPNMVGWSMGGGVSQEVAAIYPQLVSKLILMAPVTPNNCLVEEFIGEDYASFSSIDETLDFIFRVNVHHYQPHMREQLRLKWLNFGGEFIPPAQISANQGIAISKWRAEASKCNLLRNLHLPTLWIIPENDAILDYSTTISDARSQPEAQIAIINNCGHNVALEYPAKTAKLITEFLV